MKVKFLRSIAVRGNHCEEGTVQDLEDATAKELLAQGSAEATEDPITESEDAKPTKKASK